MSLLTIMLRMRNTLTTPVCVSVKNRISSCDLTHTAVFGWFISMFVMMIHCLKDA